MPRTISVTYICFGLGMHIHFCYFAGEQRKLKYLADKHSKGNYVLALGDCSNLMLYL